MTDWYEKIKEFIIPKTNTIDESNAYSEVPKIIMDDPNILKPSLLPTVDQIKTGIYSIGVYKALELGSDILPSIFSSKKRRKCRRKSSSKKDRKRRGSKKY